MRVIIDFLNPKVYGTLPHYDTGKCSFIFGAYEKEELKWICGETTAGVMRLPIMTNVPVEKLKSLNDMKHKLSIISIIIDSSYSNRSMTGQRIVDIAIGLIEDSGLDAGEIGEEVLKDNLFDHLNNKLKEVEMMKVLDR